MYTLHAVCCRTARDTDVDAVVAACCIGSGDCADRPRPGHYLDGGPRPLQLLLRVLSWTRRKRSRFRCSGVEEGPADLATLASRDHGGFPTERVTAIIKGGDRVHAGARQQ